MKKALSLLLLSSSLFSMQLAYKLQTPYNRFNHVTAAVVKNHKEKLLHAISQASYAHNTPKFQIEASSIRAPHSLADVKLYHGKKGFVILHDDKKHIIEECFMDKTARSITKEGLQSFLKIGYFALNQTNDGTFTLKAHHRLTGGGPYLGGFMYWLTKSVCYGGLAAAAGTAVVGTGGAVVGLVAGGAVAGGAGTVTALAVAGNTLTTAVVGVAGTTTMGAAITTTAGIGLATTGTAGAVITGAGVVATAAGAVVTEAAVLTAGAAVAGGASAGGIVLGIEALSLAVGSFFGMLPTP